MRQPVRRLSVATVLAAAMAFPATALAVSPHLKGGVKPNPKFTDNGLTLTAQVAYAGLGNFNTQQNLSAAANPTAECINPGTGDHRPPGQNPASVNVTGSTAVPAAEIDNGNVTITTTTDPPVTPIPSSSSSFSCPNANWTENITDMAFTSATIRVYQDTNGDGTYETLAITVSCTFRHPTTDGTVPASNYTCTTS